MGSEEGEGFSSEEEETDEGTVGVLCEIVERSSVQTVSKNLYMFCKLSEMYLLNLSR